MDMILEKYEENLHGFFLAEFKTIKNVMVLGELGPSDTYAMLQLCLLWLVEADMRT